MTSPPDITIKPVRRSIWARLSVVWLIPVAALLIALGVGWQTWVDRGPLIVISFDSASGVKARETELRYRDVNVGLVEKVGFSPSLDRVDVTVRLDKEMADFVDSDAEFWVVRPEVTAQGVTGLDTVLSGVFIEGVWNTTPDGLVEYHQGRESSPLLHVGETGTRIVLRVRGDAVLNDNTPILYKGIAVGRTGKPQLDPGGAAATTEAIIYAPHDALIDTSTRFWDTSGFSFSIGANGAKLDFKSIASLISGGLTFETIVSGGEPVSDGVVFDVYEDEAMARASVFSDSSGPSLEVGVLFEENVSGLTAGSPVEYGGVSIGQVTGLRGLVDAARFGDSRVRLLATIEIRPERLGLESDITPEAALDYLRERVGAGLRARLGTASILTGGLKVELLEVPGAAAAVMEQPDGGLPIIPSTESNVKDVAATAQGVLQRVNDLPIEEVMASIISFLDNATALINDKDLRAVPGEVSGLLAEARGVIGSDEVQKLPKSIDDLMVGLTATTNDIRGVLARLEEADAINRLIAAVDTVSVAAGEAGKSVAGVPELVEQLSGLSAKLGELPLDALVTDLDAVAKSANTLLASEAARALPESLGAALDGFRTTLSDLKTADTINRLSASMDAVGKAAGEAGKSVAGVPELVEQLSALSGKLGELPLDALIADLDAVAKTTSTLLSSDGTRDLPASLGAALDEFSVTLAELRAGGTVVNANRTLASAADAADAVAVATKDLPALVQRLDGLIAQANSTLSGFDESSGVNRDLRGAMRKVQEAADAVASLARALQRRPNSIILGR